MEFGKRHVTTDFCPRQHVTDLSMLRTCCGLVQWILALKRFAYYNERLKSTEIKVYTYCSMCTYRKHSSVRPKNLTTDYDKYFCQIHYYQSINQSINLSKNAYDVQGGPKNNRACF